MFSNMTVKARMAFLAGVTIFFTLVIGLIGFMGAVNLSSKLNEINTDGVLATRYLAGAQDAMWQLRFGISQYLAVPDPEKRKKIINESPKWFGTMDEDLKLYAATNLTAEAKDALKKMTEIYSQYKEARPKWFELMEAGKIDEAAEFRSKTILISGAASVQALTALIEIQTKNSDRLIEASSAVGRKAKTEIIIVTIVLILSSIFIATWIALSLRSQLGGEPDYAAKVMKRIADNDLTFTVETKINDKTSLLFSLKEMVMHLRQMITTIKSSADVVASASHQLSASSEQMSRGVAEQSGRSSQIATSSSEMSQTVLDIAKNASNISGSANEALKSAHDGSGVVNKTVDEVQGIAKTVSDLSSVMVSLGDRSKKIGDIISVIKDIADQTNLLALNAAIEAARAGEQGRGFAVVADEVRKLAERTAKATSETGEMISAIQTEVDQALGSMNEASGKVKSGVDEASKAGEALNKIVGSVESLQSMVQQIASATEEMSTVSETISSDIETIANVSGQTSSSSNEIAQSASGLVKLSSDLQHLVSQFRL